MNIFPRPPQAAATALLAQCDLPNGDLKSVHFDHFLGCGSPEKLEGLVGLEIFGTVALLRSLAVAETARGSGCAKALVQQAEQHALKNGVRTLCILTTTAERFFGNLGYVPADRAYAPIEIKNTQEFSGLCPSDAAFMQKELSH